MKKRLAVILAVCLLVSSAPTAAFAAQVSASPHAQTGSDFYNELVEKYADSDIEHRTEVRWWMAEGAHTDQTLEEEIQAMYDAGFRGVELCQLNDSSLDASVYGYGSEQWNHDFHVVLNKALDLGMTVGITSGTNWNTTNVPGLDPDSQAAMQGVFATSQSVKGGESINGPVPFEVLVPGSFGAPDTMQPVNEKAGFIGAYALRVEGTGTQLALGEEKEFTRLDSKSVVDLTDKVTDDKDGKKCLSWTAPEDGDYYVFFYWQQGTTQEAKPSVTPSYCVNYFDIRGFEAFKDYFSKNVLNDPELNAKIKKGDVQLFMDSLEINRGSCVTYWSEEFAKEFQDRKGYDVRPYLFLNMGLPAESELARWSPEPAKFGTFNVETDELGTKVLNDLRDVHTQLYMENYMEPMREWLHQYGIQLRAQISYGRFFEISEPSLTVDFPEAENLNQRNQVDIYRLWSGAAKLQNKVLSSETGALGGFGYSYDQQRHLQEAYALYAAGFSRINWHVWSSVWSPDSEDYQTWPGFQSRPFGPMFNPNFNVLGPRNPEYATYWEANQHLGRIQELLREGVSRTDIGIPYIKYDQLIAAQVLPEDDMWMQRHDYMIFPSTQLQENGYTYDYFSPEFLNADEVTYNVKTGTLELAGYRALVLWQDWLSVEGAQNILDLAKKGMKMVVVDGAAQKTPYNDGNDTKLADLMKQIKAQGSVKTAATADGVLEALRALDVTPYAAFSEPNYQLLTQVRQNGDDQYLYIYNYCDGSLHDDADDPDHGTHAKTDISMDGLFIPYRIDAWTGEVIQLANYRHEDGRTIVPVELDYGDVALYAFESVKKEELHVTDTNGEIYTNADGEFILRATESGTYTATLSDKNTYTNTVAVPTPYDITGWDVKIEALSASEKKITRTDTYTDSKGNTSVEFKYDTVKTPITVHLDKLVTWDKIPEVGKGMSGTGHYTATFQWDGDADGAYIDFGNVVNGMKVTVNGKQMKDLNMNVPVLDISDALVVGKNTVELESNSNLANELLEAGVLQEGDTGWAGYSIAYRSYGPAQAIVVPYVEVEVSQQVELYFTDVGKDSPYAGAVAALVKAGIAKGTGSGRFQPEAAVTTAQLAVFLGRLNDAKVDNNASVAGLVTDGWSTGYVNWAKSSGWLVGAGQYDVLDKDQVNAILSAYCQDKGIEAIAAKSASRGDVAVALDAIHTVISS